MHLTPPSAHHRRPLCPGPALKEGRRQGSENYTSVHSKDQNENRPENTESRHASNFAWTPPAWSRTPPPPSRTRLELLRHEV